MPPKSAEFRVEKVKSKFVPFFSLTLRLRDNSLLVELFDRFDEQLSLEIEGHLTRRMTKLSQL